MNENTFLNLGKNKPMSQPIGMNPIGGYDSSMSQNPGISPMMGTNQNGMPVGEQGVNGMDASMMMGDQNAMDADQNEPVMGANAFDEGGDADVSGDPIKKAESLAGQLVSILRNDLANDGINKHEDKKKEVLGMITAAIVDGMSEEDRNSMIEYLSDKLNANDESDDDNDNDDNGDDSLSEYGQNSIGGDQNTMGDAMVNEVVSSIIREFTGNDLTKKKKEHKTKVDQKEKKCGYKSRPYMTNK